MRRLLLLITLLLCTAPLTGFAQVRHCVLADGTLVYTDQRCDAIGAQERKAKPAPEGGAPQLRSYRPACPRTLRDLAFEVTSAVEAHDVNRLAGVYLWDGIGTRAGYALMDRLQAVVDRPLVDLQPVWPGNPNEPYPTTVPTRPPVALRLEQTSARGSTPIRAVFGLRKYLDCWWIVEPGARRPATRSDADAPPAAPAPLVD
ncbi:hypothetical protein DWG18_02785 [Lysobacter sp. TY2-98]|uniref:hypothetical protein n=1 Tax=Lysobacter sp. TY2-98 TaxID=2290922 RepID=UPI000E20A05C|nr:hypothetical protein [Lysobacter sp. TY2-98]AXK71317.1 hypothetical protein DWG18_02785 [Lysobacter sp. TY2-98]